MVSNQKFTELLFWTAVNLNFKMAWRLLYIFFKVKTTSYFFTVCSFFKKTSLIQAVY